METIALNKLSYGLYIVSSVDGGKYNGQIANSVFQVTSEPASVVASINKCNLTHDYIIASGCFSLSVLSIEADFKFISGFGFKSGRNIDKFYGINYKTGITGAPIVLEKSAAWLEFEINGRVDAGSHILFIGRLVDAGLLSAVEPMTYDYYHKVIKGKAPKSAPTFISKKTV
jgi:ferric-chelate reductase [NAD(P)H]